MCQQNSQVLLSFFFFGAFFAFGIFNTYLYVVFEYYIIMLTAFILGKNPVLSIAEITSYLYSRGIGYKLIDHGIEFAVFELDQTPRIGHLGGTIKIAEVHHTGTDPEGFDFPSLITPSMTKIIFGVSVYGDSLKFYRKMCKAVKKQMKSVGVSSNYFNIMPPRTATSHIEVIKQGLVYSGDIIICKSGEKYYIGKTTQIHNPFEFQKRDVMKAQLRSMYSIPPRLAKIMINLTGKKSGILLDAFCGYGAILQEAVLMGFDIKGIDINKSCITPCIKNMKWLEKEYEIRIPEIGKKVFHGDATRLGDYFEKESIDAIVSEPYLGPALREKPDAAEAKKIIKELEPMYSRFFVSASSVLRHGGRICVVSPRFVTMNGIFSVDIKKLASQNNLEVVDVLKEIKHEIPFTDSEERHRLIREINVLEKQ